MKKFLFVVLAVVLIASTVLVGAPAGTVYAAPSAKIRVGDTVCVLDWKGDIEIFCDTVTKVSGVWIYFQNHVRHSTVNWEMKDMTPDPTPAPRVRVDPKSRVRVSDAMTAEAKKPYLPMITRDHRDH